MIIYCNKFKQLVLKTYNNGHPIKDVVNTFQVCRKTLYNWRMNIQFKKYKPVNLSEKYSDIVRTFVANYTINNDRFNVRKLYLIK